MATERSPWPPGFKKARDETFAHQGALAVTAIGIESVSDNAFSIAHDVGHDRSQTQSHLAEIDVCIADRRADRKRLLANFSNFHHNLPI